MPKNELPSLGKGGEELPTQKSDIQKLASELLAAANFLLLLENNSPAGAPPTTNPETRRFMMSVLDSCAQVAPLKTWWQEMSELRRAELRQGLGSEVCQFLDDLAKS